MARPDKAERARRQTLATERKDQAEQGRLDAEKSEQEAAAVAEEKWYAEEVAPALDAAADAAYADRAIRALDDLAQLLAGAQEAGDVIDPNEIREILVGAGHPDFLPDAGWCGTGL